MSKKKKKKQGGRFYVSLPTRGRWSTEPPPPMVCHPSDAVSCVCQTTHGARLLASASSTRSVNQPVRRANAIPLAVARVHRRVSPPGRSVGHRSLPDSSVPVPRLDRIPGISMTRCKSDKTSDPTRVHRSPVNSINGRDDNSDVESETDYGGLRATFHGRNM